MGSFVIPDAPTTNVALEEESVEQTDIDRAAGIESQRATTSIIKGTSISQDSSANAESLIAKNSYTEWASETSKYRESDIENDVQIHEPEIIAQNLLDSQENLGGGQGAYGLARENAQTIVGDKGEATVQQETLNSLYQTELSRYTEQAFGTSVMETASNIGGIFIPERVSYRFDQVLREQGFIENDLASVPSRIGNMIVDTEQFNRLRGFVEKLPNDEARMAYFNDFTRVLNRQSDNAIIKADILTKVFGMDEFSTKFSTVENVLDFISVGEIAEGVVKALAKGGEALNLAARFNDGDLGARIISQASESPVAAQKLRVTPAKAQDAQDILTPTSVKEFLTGAPANIANEIVRSIEKTGELVQETLRVMNRVGVQTAEEQAVYRDIVMNKYSKMENVKSGSVEIEEVDDFVFKIKLKKQKTIQSGKNEGKTYWKSETIEEVYHVDGVDGIKNADKQYKDLWRSSPNSRMFGQVRELLVTIPERLLGEQSKLAGGLQRAMKEAYRGIWSPLSKGRIDEVLRSGENELDGVGTIYSYDALVNVGVGPNNIKLSPKEARAYYGHRKVLDELYELTDSQFTESLAIQGVKVIQNGGVNVTGFVYDTAEEAFKEYQKIMKASAAAKETNQKVSPYIMSMSDEVLDDFAPTKGIITMDDYTEMTLDWFETAYERGMMLAKNHTNRTLFENKAGKTQWAFTEAKTVRSPIGMRLLNRKAGYNPRTRENAFYFIKTKKGAGIAGAEKIKIHSTEAWANSRKEAEEWIANTSNPEKYDILLDRDISDVDRTYDVINTNGGMYLGARKSTPLEFAGDVGQGKFTNTMEAVGHYINHAAKSYPVNLYRAGLERRVVDTARKLLAKEGEKGGNARVTSLDTMMAESERTGVSSKTRDLVRSMHDQVRFLNSKPTAAEVRTSQRYHELAGKLEDSVLLGRIPGFKNIPYMLHRAGQTNFSVPNMIRGVTFKHMLGMFNPDQILVQGSGFVSALAVNPIQTLKAMPQVIGFTTIDVMRSMGNRTLKETLEWYRRNGLDEYADGYEFWANSGMYESVLHTHADYQDLALMKNLPIDTIGIRKVIASHTMPYQMGELFNTRVSFLSAYQEYKSINKLKHVAPDDVKAMEWVKTRAEQLRLNMTRANQSELNKGAIAVPLQFKQVLFKYYEKMVPEFAGGTDELTNWEKFRLAAIPAGMYGVSTVPGGNWAVEQFYEKIGRDMADVTPEEVTLVNRGLLTTAANMFGIHTNVNDRFALGTDLASSLHDAINRNISWGDLFGPAANVAKLYGNSGKMLYEAGNMYLSADEIDIPINKYQLVASVLWDAMNDIPKLGRNNKKYFSAFMMENPALYKNGQYLYDTADLNMQTAILAMGGLQMAKESELWNLKKKTNELNDQGSVSPDFLDDTAEILLRIANVHILGAKSDEQAQLGKWVQQAMYYSLNDRDRQKAYDRMVKLANERKLDPFNLTTKFLEAAQGDLNEGKVYLNEELAKSLQMRKQ